MSPDDTSEAEIGSALRAREKPAAGRADPRRVVAGERAAASDVTRQQARAPAVTDEREIAGEHATKGIADGRTGKFGYGPDGAGEQATGRVVDGHEVAGEQATGRDGRPTGKFRYGPDGAGEQATGRVVDGHDGAGEQATGTVVDGREVAGEQATGRVVDGHEVAGEQATGRVVDGHEVAGEQATGRVVDGHEVAGEQAIRGVGDAREVAGGQATRRVGDAREVADGRGAIGSPATGERVDGAATGPEHVRVGRDASGRRVLGTLGGYAAWTRPTEGVERAFVLAGGGATGIAWEAGVILGLRDGGVEVRDADTMIGTSAGSVVAAHLRVGTDEGNAFARIKQGAELATFGRLGPADAARYVRAQVHLDASEGRALVGRAALTARTTSEEEWLAEIGLGLVGKEWPQGRLFVTAVDAETGTSVVFDNASGVPLERAVAASCAVPGVFPTVEIAGRRYVDGGLRSIANIDLAAGHRRVIALAPFPIGTHLRDLPPVQLRSLRPKARTYLVVPDAKDLWAMGANPLDMSRGAGTFETARAHGRRIADRVAEVWGL